MPSDTNDFDQIVGALYETALDPARWPAAWEKAAAWLGAMSGTLYLEDRSGGRIDVLAMPGWPEKAQALYLAHYHAIDPFANFGRQAAPALRGILGQEVISAADYERSEIWNDLGRQYMGAYHFLLASLPVEGALGGLLGFHRARDAQPFDEDERGRLDRLLPHLRRAVQLGERLGGERRQAAIRSAALDGAGLGLVVVTGDGGIVFANPAAERLARRGGVVLGRRGFSLQAAHREDDRRLRGAIADAAKGGPGGALLVSCPHGARLAILVSRLPHLAEAPWPSLPADQPLALVTIRPLGDPDPGTAARLASLFGLSPAETAVLGGLMAGRSVEEIAGDRKASPLTVRTQVRHLLVKCGAQNLRDLVRLAASLG